MRIVATLNWYDEQPAALVRWVAGVATFADAVVAIDGAYAHYPDGKGRSPMEQRLALEDACRDHGLAYVEKHGIGVWDSEVAKRDLELTVGRLTAGEGGWLVRLDADEVAEGDYRLLRAELADTELDVATFTLHGQSPNPFGFPIRRVYRAQRELRCEEAHFIVKTGSRYLVGHPEWHVSETALDLFEASLRAEHRHQDRIPERNAARWAYYKNLNELQLELIRR